MAYRIVKVRRETFRVNQLSIDMFEANRFLTIREKFNNKMDKCFQCETKFAKEQTDKISLAICLGGNKVLCKKCAEEIAALNDPEVEIIRNIKFN